MTMDIVNGVELTVGMGDEVGGVGQRGKLGQS